MANEYLIRKWRVWFKSVDREHTGQLTQKDEKRTEETFLKLGHLEGEEKEKAIKTSQSQWDQFVFHGKSGPVTEAEFIESTNKSFMADKKQFEDIMRKACTENATVIDPEGKGYLTEEEYTNIYKAFGFNHDEWLKSFFNVFDNGDGKAHTDSIVDAWVHLLTSEDDSKADMLLETLEKCPDL
ncbi:sarcoplasmic calcium-binding protein-like isoform X2 [Ruditapes philippinarum]|nr:sarcoplasmic calcium-binding protein-like isoform X2 [Ruditapes philippinarum]